MAPAQLARPKMPHEIDPPGLTNQEIDAAQHLADGRLTNQEIAEKIGVDRGTLYRWGKRPDFAAHLESLHEVYRQQVLRRGIAVKERRIAALNDRHLRMQRVIEARADDPARQDVPGWTTGLLVHDVKTAGVGEAATVVDLYAVDTGLLKEIREHEKQAAIETGQWTEKRELSGGVNVVLSSLDAGLEKVYGHIGPDPGAPPSGEA
jgi:hypothetical protein